MASKREKTHFAIPINGTLAESIEKLNGELRRVLLEDIRTALESRVVVLQSVFKGSTPVNLPLHSYTVRRNSLTHAC
jgi:hypothetical protein